ncbi:MAG: YceH family protein [Gemmatimonadetes bacterium]|nr:YceH family protein [Gemmatimonadota bacterium]
MTQAPDEFADSAPDDARDHAPDIVSGEPSVPAPLLDPIEERVLGCLIEKAATTPEYYPMSLNALTNACNQKTNRNPVVEFEDKMVARALESMRDKGLVRVVTGADQRVPKHRHVVDEALGLSAAQTAVLSELMVRGPQTVGELRGRASRMYPFEELSQVEIVLQELAAREPPGVTQLPRQPGRKESRHAHLFAGEPRGLAEEDAREMSPEAATLAVRAENERITTLEESVEDLRATVAALREELASFRQQFE